MTIQQLAQQALDVQNACNLSGVARGFVRAIDGLRDLGVGGNLREHPVAQLWASKLHDLCGLGLSDVDAFGKAYDACVALAERKEVTA